MEEITKPENLGTDSLRDMSVVFFKSLNDFILFTSGYYEMAAEPPRGIVPFLDNPNFVIEVAALQTASVSLLASLFQGRLMIPALAIEYFLNNRIQTEMIFNLLKAKEKPSDIRSKVPGNTTGPELTGSVGTGTGIGTSFLPLATSRTSSMTSLV